MDKVVSLLSGDRKSERGGREGAGEGSGGDSVPQETRLAGSPHRVIFQRGWEREGPGALKGPSSQQGPGGSPRRWDPGATRCPAHGALELPGAQERLAPRDAPGLSAPRQRTAGVTVPRLAPSTGHLQGVKP